MGFIESSEGSLSYEHRPFEADCFHRKCLEIVSFEGNGFNDLFNQLRTQEGLEKGDFIWVRIPIDDIARIQQATSVGFYYVETTIIPFAVMRTWHSENYARYIKQLEPINERSLPEVELIAKHTFKGLRFNLDVEFGNSLADNRYLQWFTNALHAGEDIQVLRHKDQVVGFSLLRHDEGGVTTYRLAGIHPDYKRTGLGLTLYASTTAYCKNLGIRRVDGGISVANLAVLNTMSAVGYSFKEPTVVLHYLEG